MSNSECEIFQNIFLGREISYIRGMDAETKKQIVSEFGAAVRAMREQQCLTLAQVAGHVGMHPPAISRIERGESDPPYSTVCAIAAALGVSLSELLGECSGVTDNSRQEK